MKQTIIQVDAFTAQPFQGNPAAVCVLDKPAEQAWMQQVAQEMNLSETAFVTPREDGFDLRWFTPTTEVPLCGHATLATAHVLWSEGHLAKDKSAQFYTQSGVLIAKLISCDQGDWVQLDFPANFSEETAVPSDLIAALGISSPEVKVRAVQKNSLGYLVEIDSAQAVRDLQPNFSLLKTLAIPDVIVTSLAREDSEYDFVSRFFAPGLGIDEDPVTGAAHCCLAPYWRTRLSKDNFLAQQVSARGGVIKVVYDGDSRVLLQGQAITFLRGEIFA